MSFDIRTYFKRFPTFYYMVMLVFGPALFVNLSARGFLTKYPTSGKVLNLGSGPRIIQAGVTNVDLFPFKGVEIVADVSSVPLPDGSASRVISDNVLEHIADAQAAVKEMHRLLEPGGYAYIATPFIYPFHSSPSDFHRWSIEGYRELFKDFEFVESGTRAGPFSALCAWAVHVVGNIFSFGSLTFNSLFTNISMFVLFPIKFLDIIFAFWPRSHEVAAILYCVIRKR